MMIFCNKKMQQTPFPKLKKHSLTIIYMIYPFMQSVVRFCVEIEKKMPPQWHDPLSIVIRNPLSIFEII
jgi:hypothetical protein